MPLVWLVLKASRQTKQRAYLRRHKLLFQDLRPSKELLCKCVRVCLSARSVLLEKEREVFLSTPRFRTRGARLALLSVSPGPSTARRLVGLITEAYAVKATGESVS